ncbi:MAG: serine/threonine protein kinase [Acidobacteria bacterium]|nr:serine/threonine protein kinase [Acidobacteriota bacterium]
MTGDEWQELEGLFVELADLPADLRSARLGDLAAGRPALAGELAAMLGEHDSERPLSAESLLSEDASVQVGVLAETDPWIGRRVGDYVLERWLGGGGMGAVYAARRADGLYDHRVAVKLMQRWLHGAEAVARFRLEQQILARLEHPHIAHILDGGFAGGPEGVPFLVLELVEGEALTRYADTHRLSIRERVSLFVDVCRAVHAAHRQLVIHRDLKPDNVLVTDDGVVKLVDFGIAKLLEPDPEGGVAATRTGLRLLTPDFASPEQIRGQAITTATDVYGLGLLLYELLTGQRAQSVGEASPTTVERIVCTLEPEPPSQRLRHLDASTLGAVATARKASPAQLLRQLAGDLDGIVATCLKKEPERRYASAEEVAQDLERHLEGLPVRARPDSFAYRTGRFVRRHRLGVAAATLTVAGLILGLVLAVSGMLRAQRAEALAATEAAAARRTSDFLVELFKVSDPVGDRQELTARALLDRGAERLEGSEEVPPPLRARLLGTLAHIYLNLGVPARSAQLFRAELDARQSLDEPGNPEAVGASRSLLAAALYRSGEYAAAETEARAALAELEALHGRDSPELVNALQSLGIALWYQGDFAAAREQLQRALELVEHEGTRDRRLVGILNNVAILDAQLGDLDDAETRYRRALDVIEETRGPDHPDVAATLNNLSLVLKDRGQPEEAVKLHERALEIRLKAFGEDSDDISESRNNLGDALMELGQTRRALGLFEQAVAAREKLLGPEHPLTLSSRFNAARAMLGADRAEEGERRLEALLPVFERVFGADHYNVSYPLEALADRCLELGARPRCLDLAERAFELRNAAGGPDDPQTRRAAKTVAKVRQALAQASTNG